MTIPHWHTIYKEISTRLFHFHQRNKENPGLELYRLVTSDTQFSIYHQWIKKFKAEFGVESIDPFHVFASISAGSLSDKNRIQRIRIWLRLLKSKQEFEDIDLSGCPAPAVIRLMGARKLKNQQELWQIFVSIHEKGRRGISESSFTGPLLSFGVNLSSFTIFLFWVRPDQFLPIDANTRAFVVATGIREKAPSNAEEYLILVDELLAVDYQEGESFGANGIFRELAILSYRMVHSGEQEISYSRFLAAYLKTKGVIRYSIDSREKIEVDIEPGFKLLAIRTLPRCRTKIRKVLAPNTFYYLENGYAINGDTIKREDVPSLELYDLENTRINITAIVGQNGTGKSTLIELLFRIINNVAFRFRKELKTNDLERNKGLNAELYYKTGSVIRCIEANFQNLWVTLFNKTRTKEFKKEGEKREMTANDLSQFFYTIAVNYSHFALNAQSIGGFLNGLFHKNDAYQTPVVINPMRTDGNIDINMENELVVARLMANLFEEQEDNSGAGIRQLTDHLQAHRVTFKYLPEKSERLLGRGKDRVLFKELKSDREWLLKKLDNVFGLYGDGEKKKTFPNAEFNAIIKSAEDYLIGKLARISLTYPDYDGYFDIKKRAFDKGKFSVYLKRLKVDSSHITYKLRQAINFIRYDLVIKKPELKYVISEFEEELSNFKNRTGIKDNIELLPPPIYRATIELKNPITGNDNIPFEDLSSGEKQRIHSVNSLLYHLRNLDSVDEGQASRIRYEYINLVLDEIELYYHPEYQRTYLQYLHSMIGRLSLNIQHLNILFVTHSPFILSDISTHQVVKMAIDQNTDLAMQVPVRMKTFGANIHEMLAKSFFPKDKLMGEFAYKYITHLIEEINQQEKLSEEETHRLLKLIDIIGEPFIRTKLQEMVKERSDVDLRARMQRLIAEKRKELMDLENRLNEQDDSN